jgi:hypothetical protein
VEESESKTTLCKLLMRLLWRKDHLTFCKMTKIRDITCEVNVAHSQGRLHSIIGLGQSSALCQYIHNHSGIKL